MGHRVTSWVSAAALCVFLAYGLYSLPGRAAFWGMPPVVAIVIAAWAIAAALPIILWRRGRIWPALAVALASLIAIRVGLAMVVASRLPPGDAALYPELARNVMAGRGLVVFEPFMGDAARALFPPLFPLVLASWSFLWGGSLAAICALNLVIDGIAALMIIRLARRLGLAAAGVSAAWLYLVWPAVLWSAPLAQKEGLTTLIVLVLALQWVALAQAGRLKVSGAAGIGATAAALALTQPGLLPLAGLFGLVVVPGGVRRMLRPALVAMPIAFVAAMAPWWIRNAAVFGTFVPLTSAGGYNLWVGNNPDADGRWMPPPPELRGLPELQYGRAAGRIALDWITANPGHFVRTTLQKLFRAWGMAEAGALRISYMRPPPAHALPAAMFWLAQPLHLLLLAGASAILWVRRAARAEPLSLLVGACLLQTIGFGAFFEFGERHREFATPFLLLLLIGGLQHRRHQTDTEESPN